MAMEDHDVPVVDVGPLLRPGSADGGSDADAVAAALDRACRANGFFTVVGHGVPDELVTNVLEGARALFALPEAERRAVAMEHGGRAWRGWFPVGGELTSGRPDRKEGYYLGADLPTDDPRVRSGIPLHGPNLIPDALPGLRAVVQAYLDALTSLGHALCEGLALGLGLDRGWFRQHLTTDPTVLLRFFRYPPDAGDGWGVAEHTDYGLLTILAQDGTPGLEVHTPNGWVAVEPVPGSFVCNLGDVLEALTGGRYRSTPHRVRNDSGVDRISVPFFFDPSWEATVTPLPLGGPVAPGRRRWDGAASPVTAGTYGEHLLAKVSKVFPDLFRSTVAGDGEPG
jgi:isopenicillin N synthase-like dioxygenase